MKKLYMLAFLMLGIVSFAGAQHHIGFYLNGATPFNQLNDSGYRNGIGFSAEYLSPSLFAPNTRSPFEVRVGAGIEFFHHGSSKKVEDLVFNTPNNDLGSSKLQNQMFGFFVAPKFIFNVGRFSPYVDVFANARIFNSYQVNRFNKEVQGYERTSNKPVVQNAAAHYGGSVGLIYNLGSRIAFDARVSYSTGSAINFVDLKSPAKDPDLASGITYRTVRTPVSDMLTYRIGILIKLDNVQRSQSTHYTPNNNRINLTPNTPAPRPAEVKPVPKPTPPVNH
ncbi:MAG: hypothetical protein F9K23_04785 [Bacteroidetes bacterium]|nr:MAG: hypothetical protein F9K23_04785 [Bacteroidota bacterium]